MATVLATPSAAQHFVIRDGDWRTYQGILQALGERPIRVTYHRGVLELMTLSHGHERCSNLLGQFVEVLTDELDLPRQSAGSTTLNREDVESGLEADQSYYLENEPLVREKDDIDLDVDPPPDLAVEVDISRSSRSRMPIYAALRVPEVWRYDGETLRVYRLGPDGKYVPVERSSHFPFLPIEELAAFLQRRTEMSETALVRLFRNWVREQIARGWRQEP